MKRLSRDRVRDADLFDLIQAVGGSACPPVGVLSYPFIRRYQGV
ncbi:MAG: hypothetical protein VYD70_07230 [Planctomycetota bacterium]|nr:hypothetical protein [Planctomycetota bacterium]